MIRVLLCIQDDNVRSRLREIVQDMGLEVVSESTTESSLGCVGRADTLLMDWNIGDLAPDVLLDLWRKIKDGPVAILYHDMPDEVHTRLLSERQIWNVMPYPADMRLLKGAVQTLLVRYVQHVQRDEQLAGLKLEIKRLRWWVTVLTGIVLVLAVAVAALVVAI